MRVRAAALLLLVVPLAVAACGGSGKSSKQSGLAPPAAVRQAATKTAAQTSQHMVLKGTATLSGQAVAVSGDGDFEDRAGSLHLDFNAAGLTGGIDAVVDGTDLYLRSPLFADALPQGKKWLKLDLAKVASASGVDLTSLAAQSPAQVLSKLRTLRNVTEVGSEQVGGVDTTHYRGRVVKTATATAPGRYDVWVGDDGYVHRVRYAASIAAKQRLNVTMDLSDFGKDVHVTVPSAGESLDATNLNIPGLGG